MENVGGKKVSEWTLEEKALLKTACEASLLFFMRYFFKVREGSRMIVSWHHEVMCDFWRNHFNVDSSKGNVRFYATTFERDVIRAEVMGTC